MDDTDERQALTQRVERIRDTLNAYLGPGQIENRWTDPDEFWWVWSALNEIAEEARWGAQEAHARINYLRQRRVDTPGSGSA